MVCCNEGTRSELNKKAKKSSWATKRIKRWFPVTSWRLWRYRIPHLHDRYFRKQHELLSLCHPSSSPFCLIFPGPTLNTLCTAVFDLDKQALAIIEGNPKKGEISHVFSITLKESKTLQWKLEAAYFSCACWRDSFFKILMQAHRGLTRGHQYIAWLQPDSTKPFRFSKSSWENNMLRTSINIETVTFPWTSYLMGPSSSAPNAINFVTVLLMSFTVNDRSVECPFCMSWSLKEQVSNWLVELRSKWRWILIKYI